MKHGILMHRADDDVGVAVADLARGTEVGAITLEGQPVRAVTLVDDVPLGHKVAMRDIARGRDVLEYGRIIGIAVADARVGAHVHTHTVKTKRWA